MRVFAFNIFNAAGECMYQRDWSRERVSADEETEHKTLFGLFFTLKDFAKQLDPLGGAEGPCNFYAFTTNNYKLHFYETATGLRFLLTTDETAGDLRAAMKHIYSVIYVEYVVRNVSLQPMKPFASNAFEAALDAYVTAL